ncbi:hypothetical protein WDZ16_10515 [Pseudokineococcus marinus]|uniref:Uncharacterized protein n=1 Tax=Pseudokineococcus marinus TaxID=351215 RepID=A0A849BNI5_9ACTN|nr:hypothetical protein [Pseudokineococcus marinus]NNH22607.1 hypothetical protein [Pseudokineococcus marinus]
MEVEVSSDPTIEELVVRDATDEQLMTDWSILVGDAVHNARSALDHAVWRLVEASGETPDRYTQFPTAATRSGLKTGSLRGVHPYVREAVYALEPWEGGAGHWLWVLTQLDNIDKHRLLLRMSPSSNTLILVRRSDTEEWGEESVGTEGHNDGDVLRSAPVGTMRRSQTTGTVEFVELPGDTWDGKAIQGWSLPAEITLERCFVAAGDALNAMSRAMRRALEEQEGGIDPTT